MGVYMRVLGVRQQDGYLVVDALCLNDEPAPGDVLRHVVRQTLQRKVMRHPFTIETVEREGDRWRMRLSGGRGEHVREGIILGGPLPVGAPAPDRTLP